MNIENMQYFIVESLYRFLLCYTKLQYDKLPKNKWKNITEELKQYALLIFSLSCAKQRSLIAKQVIKYMRYYI